MSSTRYNVYLTSFSSTSNFYMIKRKKMLQYSRNSFFIVSDFESFNKDAYVEASIHFFVSIFKHRAVSTANLASKIRGRKHNFIYFSEALS